MKFVGIKHIEEYSIKILIIIRVYIPCVVFEIHLVEYWDLNFNAFESKLLG